MAREAQVVPGRRSDRPLHGRHVLITRSREQGATLADGLQAAGAAVVWCPLLRIVPPTDPRPLRRALQELASYDWIAFTSRNGVEQTLAHCEREPPPTWPAIAAIGSGTALALHEHGLTAALVPTQMDAPGLAAALIARRPDPGRILLLQADNAKPTLVELLTVAGWQVTTLTAYQGQGIVYQRPPIDLATCDACTFASSATVERFAAIPGLPARWPTPVAIGRQTGATLAAHGQTAAAIAVEPTIPALVAAVIAALAPSRRR